ncbi:zinc finger CCCH domain-containing protein 10-like [Episyrphus balteatus]|uniref:zinc finger CCCH domain-containing protein 10-like n=1 Tax=Episyrphus balteatus TaxID=286459 RepID=UPI002485E317|nr:zinc finger CCCH domain-containing protein 10-like [Episyrphus balteatus]
MNQACNNLIDNNVTNMCNNNQNNANSNNSMKNRICRDFVRGICRRKHCRYPHVVSPDLVVFCHDYQNSTCTRANCKFLHYTIQEQEYYNVNGEFPPEVSEDNQSICNEYAMYRRCRHKDCYMMDKRQSPPPMRPVECIERQPVCQWNHNEYRGDLMARQGVHMNGYRAAVCDDFPSSLKRPANVDTLENSAAYKRFRDDIERIDIVALVRRFEEEQVMLRRRVEANEIKIAELRASNEYLLAQNAQLRLTNVQCSAVVNPVTMTQTTSQQQTQLIGGVSIAPVQVQATPIVSIATPQTQIITSSGTPLAIAANTSQGQQLAISQQNITSLSNTTQQLAPTHAQQILGTSQITLTPALAQGLTINTSQALAMSNASQPIISYPIMTHSILPH